MENVKDSLVDLERHRRRLEENITELQNALLHWRTWDAEYEALKEEVESADDSDQANLERIKNEFEGELVNRKEVAEIFGKAQQRSRDQIINVLDRRIDYVSKSVETLQKQLEAVEHKHAAASIISQPDIQDDEGRPITEIVEELDSDDNVVSYRLNQPGQSMPHVREALQKAGIKDLPSISEDSSSNRVSELSPDEQQASPLKPKQQSAKHDVGMAPAKSPPVTKKAPKKSVAFADEVAPAEESGPSVSKAARRVEDIMKSAKSQEDMMNQKPVIPENEDPEDAALRRQMLNYGMGEVGAVVAELQLEDGASDVDSDHWDYSDEGFDESMDDAEDDEDKYGRSTLRVVTQDYRQRMLELEQRLGINSKSPAKQKLLDDADGESGSEDERIGRIVVNHGASASPSAAQKQPEKPATLSKETSRKAEKKGVRFAESLDIRPDSPPPAPAPQDKESVTDPLGDVVEREVADKPVKPKTPRKASRFRKARGEAAPNDAIPKAPMDITASFTEQDKLSGPSGPPSQTLADTLVERDTVSEPMNDEDFEDMIDQGALALEHQRLRRKFIQQQGGFLKENESPIQPLDETEGGPERLSRFRAARLSK